QRAFQPFGGFHRADPAEFARRQDGEKIKPKICRRRAARHHGLGVLLEIVRREVMVLGGDKFFEESPSAACHTSQRACVLLADRKVSDRRRRAARPPRDARRTCPGQQKWRGDYQSSATRAPNQKHYCERK